MTLHRLLVLLVLVLPALARAAVQPREIEHDGQTRRYLESIPATAAPVQGWPVVFMLHGGGGSPESFRELSRMDEVGEAEGFVTVYGDALAGGWTAGVGADPTGAAEAAYLDAVLADVRARHPLDESRLHVSGHSNGGEMASIWARSRPGLFAGLATVNSPVLEEHVAEPLAYPLHALLMRGTADPLVPLTAGEFGGTGRIGVSFADALTWWIDNLRVEPPPASTPLPQVTPDDATSTTQFDYSPGHGGARLRVLVTAGGGHGWPGSPGGLPPEVIGVTAQDFSASAEIWQFLEPLSRIEPVMGDAWMMR